MSIIPFEILEKQLKIKNIKSFCLLSCGKSYGSMYLSDGFCALSLINLSVPNNVFGGIIDNPGFPLEFDKGSPTKFLLGDAESLNSNLYSPESNEQIGHFMINQCFDDPLDRVGIFLTDNPPKDLDGHMWGIDQICIDCKDCYDQTCPCRGQLPWNENSAKE